MAALAAVEGPLWLLAGGRAKGTDFHSLGRAVCSRATGVALFGEARGELIAGLESCRGTIEVHAVEHLAEAFAWCWQRSRIGDSIVLSPACASHDQFQDFQARGAAFSHLVAELQGRD